MKKVLWGFPAAVVVGTVVACGIDAPAARAALLVGNTEGDNVLIFDEQTGEFGGQFIRKGKGGLISPDDLTFGPDGNLYISSGTNTTGAILKFDGTTGKFLGRFDKGGSLLRPYGVAFGPDGNLYVSSFRSDEILRYNGTTGDFIDVFATGTGTADGLNGPNDLLFDDKGNLYVTTQGSVADDLGGITYLFASQVLRYNIFSAPTPTVFQTPTTNGALGFISLLGLTFGPTGDLFVSDFANAIRRYDLGTGALLDEFFSTYPGPMGNLAFDPNGILYTPGFTGTGNIGAISRFDGDTGNPLPAPGESGSIFIPPLNQLKRPIGIAYTPISVPESVPEPGITLGLLGLGVGYVASRLKRDRSTQQG